jgi:uracil-DNA glycosylase family 4
MGKTKTAEPEVPDTSKRPAKPRAPRKPKVVEPTTEQLALVKAPHARCWDCPLVDQPKVEGHGPDNASLCIVGEAPGAEEVRAGKPFIGKSGQLLNRILASNGIEREGCYVTNSVLCRPARNATPNKQAVVACHDRLVEELISRAPKQVLALGGPAVQSLLGTNDGVTKVRLGGARPLPSVPGATLIPTFHPAFALRNPDMLPTISADIARLSETHVEVVWEPTKYNVCSDPHNAPRWLERQAQFPMLALDIENGIEEGAPNDVRNIDWLCIGMSHQAGHAVVYDERVVRSPQFRRTLEQIMASRANTWVMQNGKYDIQALWEFAPSARVDEDTMLMHFACHATGTRVLTRDFRWVPIEHLLPGDEIVAFDEKNTGDMKPGVVESKKIFFSDDAWEVETRDGIFTVTGDHLWPVSRSGWNKRQWRTTRSLAANPRAEWTLAKFLDPWEEPDPYIAGWMAGFFDGEGCIRKTKASHQKTHTYTISVSQNPGVVLEQAKNYLKELGVEVQFISKRTKGKSKVHVLTFSKPESLRLVGMTKPSRFVPRLEEMWVGPKKNTKVPIVSVRKKPGIFEFVAVATSTKTLIAEGFLSHNCDERKGTHGLEDLGTSYLNAPNWKSDAKRYLPRQGASYRNLPRAVLHRYNATDCDVTFRLVEPLRKEMAHDDVESVYRDLLIPGSNALARMEYEGVKVDEELLDELQRQFRQRRDDVEIELRQWVENPRSVPQVKAALESLGYNVASTDRETLEGLALIRQDDFIEKLLDHRDASKFLGTYLVGLRKKLLRGRVHADFKLHGTETGRLSSANPNLQNQPRTGNIRNLYIADEGNILVEADYNQIEYRLAGEFSGDSYINEAFREGRNLHEEAAQEFYGPRYKGKDKDKEKYVTIKTVNFGLIYKETPGHLAARLHIPFKDAQKMERLFNKRQPRLRDWQAEVAREIVGKQYITSLFGRKRRFWLITEENRKDVIKEGCNFMLQSPASDLTLRALIRLTPLLAPLGARPIISIHDALVVETPKGTEVEVAALMKEVMEDNPEVAIPTTVEIKIGTQWGSMEEVA